MNQKLAIITVIFENYQVLDDFFRTLENQTDRNFYLFLVDVSSQKKEIKNKKLPLTFISAQNFGYSHAVNLGLKRAIDNGFSNFCVVNSDVFFKNDFVKEVRKGIRNHPSAIIGGKIYYASGFEYHKTRYEKKDLGKVIWYAGGLIDWKNVLVKHRGVDEVDTGQYDTEEKTEFVTGCLMAFDKKVIDKVGFWEESYFLYFEDADFCVRAKKKGIDLYYNPKIIIWHKNAQSTGGSGSETHLKHQTKNRLRFGIKYAPLKTKIFLGKEYIQSFLNQCFNFLSKNKFLFLLIILAILFRFLITQIGLTYDLESFHIVGDLIYKGKNIYAETFRYNYSPIWALVLGIFKWVSYFFDNHQLIFRSLIILTLSLADMAIAFWLWRQVNFYLFLLFLFNPLSIYITGFHNQFDNLAIAFALWASILIDKKKEKDKLLGYLILSFSIALKHIFIFIIPWLFFREKTKKEKFFSLLPIFLFLFSFVPFIFSKEALLGIWKNVFTYQMAGNIYPFFPFKGIWRPVILLILFSLFYFLVKNQKLSKQFVIYLLLITALSPIAASQYLIIPIVGHLIVAPLLGVLYVTLTLLMIFFKVVNFISFVIPIFQLSWLSFLVIFYPSLINRIKRFIVGFVIFFVLLYSYKTFNELKLIYQEQRKEVLIMRVFYPVKEVFEMSKKLIKEPLVKDHIVKGEFYVRENNLGFITIPFELENPSGKKFFKENYYIGSSITQSDNKKVSYQEMRKIDIALTQDGIILGFPIQNQSKGKKYEVNVFSTIPREKDYVMIDRHRSFQARHFLTKDMLKDPFVLFPFIWHKFYYFFSLKSTWVLLIKIYSIIWIILCLMLFIIKKNHNNEKLYR